MSQNDQIIYKRNLPHIHPKDAILFITFRLAESLPANVLRKLQQERENEIDRLRKRYGDKEFEREKYKLEKRHFGRLDEWLDRAATGPQWLKEERLARIVADKMHALDGKNYKLIAYCIMSNHVHLLFDTSGYDQVSTTNVAGKTKNYPVGDTMRLLKGSTSRFCSLELKRTGAFWHKESYDHFVRDDEELHRIIEYILNNPVKAGLVENCQEWQFSYVNGDLVG